MTRDPELSFAFQGGLRLLQGRNFIVEDIIFKRHYHGREGSPE